jgi:hypothetical protein
MSTLGKVLAAANVLAVLVFFYLVVADWGQRQSWAYAAFRTDLALDGLPVNIHDADTDGVRRVDKLSDATFQEVLRPAGGPAAQALAPADKTQEAEAKRVHDHLLTEINGLGGDPAKRERLAALLLPLTRTLGERQALALRIQEQPIANLLAPDGPFEQALKPALAGPAERDPGDQQRAIAHLLFNLAGDDAARQRAAVVVGLRAFATEADQQAAAIQRMAEQLRDIMAADRARFEADYNHVIADLHVLATDLEARQRALAKQRALVEQHRILLNTRAADLKLLKDQLETARQNMKGSLDEVAREQQRLFRADRQVGQALEQNLHLEEQIRMIEGLTSDTRGR